MEPYSAFISGRQLSIKIVKGLGIFLFTSKKAAINDTCYFNLVKMLDTPKDLSHEIYTKFITGFVG